MAGRKVSADATKGTALFAAGQRQWISLRVMWPQILMYSQKCPDVSSCCSRSCSCSCSCSVLVLRPPSFQNLH